MDSELDPGVEWKEMNTFYIWKEKFRILEWPKGSNRVITSCFLISIFLFFLKIIFSWHMATLNKDRVFQSPLHVYRQVTKFWPMRYYWT